MRTITLPALLAALSFGAPALAAQSLVAPVRPLGRAGAVSAETFSRVTDVRGLPDGRVLVHVPGDFRVLLLDSTLATARVVADTTATTERLYGRRAGRLVPFRGDSSVYIDPGSLSMHVLDADGRVARVMAVPRPQEASALAVGDVPGFDPAGRLVYRVARRGAGGPAGVSIGGVSSAGRPAVGDTFPVMVIRVDVATRAVDTAAVFVVRTSSSVFGTDLPSGAAVRLREFNPLADLDAWALLSDGTVALVHGKDYRVDLERADGTRAAGPKIPFEWQRMSDDDKAAYVDSLRRAQTDRLAREAAARPAGHEWTGVEAGTLSRRAHDGELDLPGVEYDYVPASKLPDYRPAFTTGAVRADADGRLWVRLFSLPGVGGGAVYDVLDRSGKRVDRVQLPAGRALAGFGPGAVYLTAPDAAGVRLERVRVR